MKSLRLRRVRAARLSLALRPVFAAAAFSVLAASASTRAQAADSGSGIIINIDGRNVEAPAILQSGSVLVPLRGVLEELGARVAYDAAEKRIDIFQDGKKTQLRIGQENAISDVRSIKLTAAPQIIDKTTYVPLRSLAELFGYEVRWLGAQKTVAISSGTAPHFYADHRKALKDAGALGVIIDFSDASTQDADKLLDAAKASGVTLIKTRFDWEHAGTQKRRRVSVADLRSRREGRARTRPDFGRHSWRFGAMGVDVFGVRQHRRMAQRRAARQRTSGVEQLRQARRRALQKRRASLADLGSPVVRPFSRWPQNLFAL